MNTTKICFATIDDVPEILKFIIALAIYEKLEHEAVVTEDQLTDNLFGKKAFAEVLFLEVNQKKVGFALFFHNFSTFLGKPGIYLEDLFVLPEERGHSYGKILLAYLAKLTIERNCGRLEWSVLNWNTPAIDFYKSLGALSMNDWTSQRLVGEKLKDLAKHNLLK